MVCMAHQIDDKHWSILHHAAYNADERGVREAIQDGHSIEIYDCRGFTALLWSCLRGAVGNQQPVARLLLAAGADPNAETLAGDSNCIVLAAQSGNPELIRVLIENGAEIDRPADGVTALMTAARNGDEASVQTLLSLGARPEIAAGGYNAADYARYGGYDEIAQIIDTANEHGKPTD